MADPIAGVRRVADFIHRRWGLILLGITAGFALGQFIFFTESRFFEWDEAVYYSQVSPHQDALHFAATRARGITLLVAPVAVVTGSLSILRVFLIIVSSCALFAAFRVWGPVRPTAAVLGAALFGSTWIALLYGSEISPNLYSALGSVALAGLYLRALTSPGSRPLEAAMVGAAILVGLFRPYDLAIVGLGLLIGGIVTTRAVTRDSGGSGRRWLGVPMGELRTHAVLAGGVVLGGVPWLIENSIRFGGPIRAVIRAIDDSSGVGVSGWGFHLPAHLSVTDGPIITYDTTQAIPLGGVGWWLTWAALAVIGIVLARRGRRRPAVVVSVAGLFAVGGYIFLLPIVPRFLSPGYALVGLAAGFGLAELLERMSRGSRAALAGMLVALAALAPLGYWQLRTANTVEADQRLRRLSSLELGRVLTTHAGGQPCAIWSQYGSVQIAMASGCEPHVLNVAATEPNAAIIAAAGRFDHVFLLSLSWPGPESYLHGLPRIEVPVTFGRPWHLYFFTDPPDSG